MPTGTSKPAGAVWRVAEKIILVRWAQIAFGHFTRRPKGDDFFITTLKYVRAQAIAGKPPSTPPAVTHVQSVNRSTPDQMIKDVYQDALHPRGGGMTTDAYFQLLEYEELQEARLSSLKAFDLAFGALLVSSLIGLTSIAVAVS